MGGFKLCGTPGTAKYYKDNHGLDMKVLCKPVELDDHNPCSDTGASSALQEIKDGRIKLVVNISEGTNRKDEISSGYIIRRAAVDFGASLVVNLKCAVWLAASLDRTLEDFKAK